MRFSTVIISVVIMHAAWVESERGIHRTSSRTISFPASGESAPRTWSSGGFTYGNRDPRTGNITEGGTLVVEGPKTNNTDVMKPDIDETKLGTEIDKAKALMVKAVGYEIGKQVIPFFTAGSFTGFEREVLDAVRRNNIKLTSGANQLLNDLEDIVIERIMGVDGLKLRSCYMAHAVCMYPTELGEDHVRLYGERTEGWVRHDWTGLNGGLKSMRGNRRLDSGSRIGGSYRTGSSQTDIGSLTTVDQYRLLMGVRGLRTSSTVQLCTPDSDIHRPQRAWSVMTEPDVLEFVISPLPDLEVVYVHGRCVFRSWGQYVGVLINATSSRMTYMTGGVMTTISGANGKEIMNIKPEELVDHKLRCMEKSSSSFSYPNCEQNKLSCVPYILITTGPLMTALMTPGSQVNYGAGVYKVISKMTITPMFVTNYHPIATVDHQIEDSFSDRRIPDILASEEQLSHGLRWATRGIVILSVALCVVIVAILAIHGSKIQMLSHSLWGHIGDTDSI